MGKMVKAYRSAIFNRKPGVSDIQNNFNIVSRPVRLVREGTHIVDSKDVDALFTAMMLR